jgi:hypothetical protein
MMRLMTRVRSRFAVVKARCNWRRSSSSTLGTRTIRHTFRSPATWRRSIVSNCWTSSRSVLARRCRRLTAMLDESTTQLATPWVTHQRWSQKPSRPASSQLMTGASAGSPKRS